MTKRRKIEPSRPKVDVVRDPSTENSARSAAVTYIISPKEVLNIAVADSEVDVMPESGPAGRRANRYLWWRIPVPAPKLSKLSERAFPNEALIVFAPLVTRRDALKILKRAIRTIESDGLLIGPDEDGNLMWDSGEDENN